MMLNRVALVLTLAIAGCGKSAPSNEAASAPANDAVATANAAPQIKTKPATPLAPPPLSGKFEATSTTAMGITGDLTFTPGQVKFELDQGYKVGHPQLVDASSPMSRSGDTWVDVLIIPKEGKVALWPVIDQVIGKRGRQQSLCGQGGKVGFIATADREDGLALAAFSGEKVPGPGMDDTALCGTYFYGRVKK